MFSPDFCDQQKTLLHNPAIAILSVTDYIFIYLFVATGWRSVRINKHSLMMETVPAGRWTAF